MSRRKRLAMDEVAGLAGEIVKIEEQIKKLRGKKKEIRNRLLAWVRGNNILNSIDHVKIRIVIKGCRDEKTRRALMDSITGKSPAISHIEMEYILAGQ